MALTLMETDIKTKNDTDYFSFVFASPINETEYTKYTLTFDFKWNHSLVDIKISIPAVKDYPDTSDRIKGAWIGDSVVFSTDNAQRLFKKYFKSLEIGLPETVYREILEIVLQHWIDYKKCPMALRRIDHPQFPLLEVIYNTKAIKSEKVNALIKSIMRSIVKMKSTVEKREVEEKEEDDFDEYNIENALNYEWDEEVGDMISDTDVGDEEFASLEDTGEIIDEEEEE